MQALLAAVRLTGAPAKFHWAGRGSVLTLPVRDSFV